MKTDRELLELAAKAAGIKAQWDCPERGMMMLTPDGIDTMSWNPLKSRLDAVDLVFILGFDVTLTGDYVKVKVPGSLRHIFASYYGMAVSEKNALVCRAIVQAAAEVGEATIHA